MGDKSQFIELCQMHTIELRSIVIPRSKELGQFQYVRIKLTNNKVKLSEIPNSLREEDKP